MKNKRMFVSIILLFILSIFITGCELIILDENSNSVQETPQAPSKQINTPFGSAPIINSVISGVDSLIVTFTKPTVKTKADGYPILSNELYYLVYVSDIPPKDNDPHILVNNVTKNYSSDQDFISREIKNVIFITFRGLAKTITRKLNNLKENTTFYITIEARVWRDEELTMYRSPLASVESGMTSTSTAKSKY